TGTGTSRARDSSTTCWPSGSPSPSFSTEPARGRSTQRSPATRGGSVITLANRRHKAFVLQAIQPSLLGLMDGSVSTLAPIFATAGLTGRPLSAFFVGLAASLGAAISMGLSEALSDDGSVTGRGGPLRRGIITGVATGIGGMLHTLPFLVPDLGMALKVAYAVVVCDSLHPLSLH